MYEADLIATRETIDKLKNDELPADTDFASNYIVERTWQLVDSDYIGIET